MLEPEVIFVNARSVSASFPERWWVPSAALLDAAEPGRSEVKLLAVEVGADGQADLWSARAVWLAVEERDGQRLTGSVTSSWLPRDGYRKGDRITATLDRVLDLVQLDEDGDPLLNEERARFAVGKRVLVAVTAVSPAGEEVDRQELAGTVVAVEPERGVQLRLTNEEPFWLPPDVRGLEEAQPGQYRLRDSGEVVVDPDYLWHWTVQQTGHRSAVREGGFHP